MVTFRNNNNNNSRRGNLRRNTRSFKPNNDTKNNIRFSVNLNELKQYTGLIFSNHTVILEGNIENSPLPKKIKANLSNNHLKYALTWYSLALTILLYFLYFRKKQ